MHQLDKVCAWAVFNSRPRVTNGRETLFATHGSRERRLTTKQAASKVVYNSRGPWGVANGRMVIYKHKRK